MQRILLSLLFTLAFIRYANTQYDGLKQLKNDSVNVYYSNGHQERASSIALQMSKALAYHQQLLEFKPTVTLLVLSQADWKKFTSFPVYGMPHYNDNQTLIVASEDNAFWKSFLPAINSLPGELQQKVQAVYKSGDGDLSMQPFFDLLAIHELGHAFHFQGQLNMQRKWMGELFANILLHTYIAENNPEALPALTVFPQMVINRGSKEFRYTSLKNIEDHYEMIGKQYPQNYGWYQCRWHAAAAEIYNSSGKEICKKLWMALKSKKEKLPDEELFSFLETAGAKSVADVMREWDKNTK